MNQVILQSRQAKKKKSKSYDSNQSQYCYCCQHENCKVLGVCLSKSCQFNSIFCEQNQAEHRDHFKTQILDFCAILSNVCKTAGEKLAYAQDVQAINESIYNDMKINFQETEKLLQQTFQDILNLQQYNREVGSKILSKNITVLQNLKQFQDFYQSICMQGTITNSQSMMLQQLINKFVQDANLTSNIDDESEMEYHVQHLLYIYLQQMQQKSDCIKEFDSEIKQQLLNQLSQVNQQIKQIKRAQRDVKNILENKIKHVNENDQITVYVQHLKEENDQPSSFKINRANIEFIADLQDEIEKFYNVQIPTLQIEDCPTEENEFQSFIDRTTDLICYVEVLSQPKKNFTIIGVSGPTRSGKGNLATHLSIKYNAIQVNGDNFFDKSKIYKDLEGNWDTPDAISWDKFKLKIKEQIQYAKQNNYNYFIIESFMLFYDREIYEMCNLKLFLDINEEEIWKKRMSTFPVDESYFQQCILPGYRNYRKFLEQYQDIHYLDGQMQQKQLLDESSQLIDSYKN